MKCRNSFRISIPSVTLAKFPISVRVRVLKYMQWLQLYVQLIVQYSIILYILYTYIV